MSRYTRAFRLYQIAAWHQFIVLTGYATYLSLVPDPGGAFTSIWDKLLHFVAWFVLTFSLRLAWPAARFPAWAAAALFLYSGVVEMLQYFSPERDANFNDMLGNGLGIVVAYGLALLIWPPLERHLLSRLRAGNRR